MADLRRRRAGRALFQRQRARAENLIRETKACGLANLPFDDVVNNDVWMQLAFTAHDLLVWAQQISLTGALRRATPQGRRLDLDRTWPWTTTTLLDAIARLRHALQPLTVA